MINWRVRLKNKTFWLTAVPAALLLISQVLKLFGVEWDYTGLAEQLTAIVGTIFAILALLGVVNDPTTQGMGDSQQALDYDKPKSDWELKNDI
mgnify:CR=1 FL=1